MGYMKEADEGDYVNESIPGRGLWDLVPLLHLNMNCFRPPHIPPYVLPHHRSEVNGTNC